MNVSEVAAAAWLAGGIVATAALQAATGGEHSVSRGLRDHPVAFGVLAFAFLAHVYQRPRWAAPLDPFRLLAARRSRWDD